MFERLFHFNFQAEQCWDPVLWNIAYLLELMQYANTPVFICGELMIGMTKVSMNEKPGG